MYMLCTFSDDSSTDANSTRNMTDINKSTFSQLPNLPVRLSTTAIHSKWWYSIAAVRRITSNCYSLIPQSTLQHLLYVGMYEGRRPAEVIAMHLGTGWGFPCNSPLAHTYCNQGFHLLDKGPPWLVAYLQTVRSLHAAHPIANLTLYIVVFAQNQLSMTM